MDDSGGGSASNRNVHRRAHVITPCARCREFRVLLHKRLDGRTARATLKRVIERAVASHLDRSAAYPLSLEYREFR